MSSDPLVFPLGHYMGALYPKPGAPLAYRRVRIGADVRRITDDDSLRIWALAHGMPERIDKIRWTREALLETAETADPERVLDALVADGLVALVSPGTPEAVRFARSHRLQPLLTGLGNSPDDPMRFSLGIPGSPAVVKVESFVYEIWQWCRLGDDLWQTADMFASAEREVSSGRGITDGAERLLTEILEQLHHLLAYNAGYLDLARGVRL